MALGGFWGLVANLPWCVRCHQMQNFKVPGGQKTECRVRCKENGKAVKPLAPYSRDPQVAEYGPFIDYETG